MTVSRELIYSTPHPVIGLVIGTYAAVPYIHLGLESRHRNYPSVPTLVHDDASKSGFELGSLCRNYGVDFSQNAEHLGHFMGDLTVFLRGLEWARMQGIELLVKFSRRFIPLFDWVPDLQDLAWSSQYATFSNVALSCGLRFRTECVAIHVDSWFVSGAVAAIRRQIALRGGMMVESFLHQMSRGVHHTSCAYNREYELLHPKAPGIQDYGDWGIMGSDRHLHIYNIIWRHSCGPTEYCRASLQYGLDAYSVEDFAEVPGAQGKFMLDKRDKISH